MLKTSKMMLLDAIDKAPHFKMKALTWISVFVTALWPELVFAQADTLGALMCNVEGQTGSYPVILSAVCYIAGAFIIIRGVLFLKKHAENPGDSQMTKGFAHLFGGALLLALPAFAGVLRNSIFGTVSGGSANCAAGGASLNGSQGLDVMMQNFVRDIHGPATVLISVIAFLVGATFIAKGLFKAVKTGSNPQQSDPKSIINHFVIGAILITSGTMFSDVMQSLFGSTSVQDMFSYDGIAWERITGGAGASENAQNTVNAILAFVQIIGMIAFIRGWMVLKTALDGGQATVTQGIVFVVAGTMAVNIDRMLSIFDNTFGTGIIN